MNIYKSPAYIRILHVSETRRLQMEKSSKELGKIVGIIQTKNPSSKLALKLLDIACKLNSI